VLSALPQGAGAAAAMPRVIMAYEPHWAIGAPRPAPTDHVADVCRRVRAGLTDHVPDLAVIYGGSAGPGLLADLDDTVDGLFLGRFAHDPQAVAGVLADAGVLRNRRNR
jgi:triosephosphate isomerase